jgi:DNA-binding transcriptional LysR family regulator
MGNSIGEMEISHLRYFVHVAQTASFSRGAALAHVSPPAITKAIQRLEAEAGARLFERTTRRVVLTEEGKVVLRHARAILGQVDEIARDLDELRNTVSGELRVGAMEVFSVRVLPMALAALVAQFPRVTPLVHEMHPESIQRHLAEGRLDVGFTIGPAESEEIISLVLGTSPGRVVCGRSHPLYTERRITAAALGRHAFVVPRFFGREYLPSLDQFPEERYPRQIGATIELLQMMVELVISGSYLGHLPQISIAHHLATGDLAALKGLAGLPRFDLRALTRRGPLPRRSATLLIHEIQRIMAVTSESRRHGRGGHS